MTHLSDFSFLQRAVTLSYILIWYVCRVWSIDRFRSLHPRHFKQGELKSIVSLLIFVMLPFQLYYDITSCRIKYEEGFIDIFGHIIAKPEMKWTEADQNLVTPTDYSLCVGFSLQTGTLLLLQCFWNYLANTVARAKFMSSKEFKFYIVWTVTALFMFPILQFLFSRENYDPTYKEIMPELVYGVGLFIIACLGVRSYFRFQNLLNMSRDVDNSRFITFKIRHFQELNLILTFALFIASICLITLCLDGLTVQKTLNTHKFSSDFLICTANTFSIVAWVLLILIVHPKKEKSMNGSSTSRSPPVYASQSGRSSVPPIPAVPRVSKHSSTYSKFNNNSKSYSYDTDSLPTYSPPADGRKGSMPAFQESNVSSQAEMMAIGVDPHSDRDSTRAVQRPLVDPYRIPSVNVFPSD